MMKYLLIIATLALGFIVGRMNVPTHSQVTIELLSQESDHTPAQLKEREEMRQKFDNPSPPPCVDYKEFQNTLGYETQIDQIKQQYPGRMYTAHAQQYGISMVYMKNGECVPDAATQAVLAISPNITANATTHAWKLEYDRGESWATEIK